MKTVTTLSVMVCAFIILGAPFANSAEKNSKDTSMDRGYIPREGIIPTKEVALKVAEAVLVAIYGEELIKVEKPFKVALKNDIWLIEGTLPDGLVGGVAEIKISKQTGEVLYVMHGK